MPAALTSAPSDLPCRATHSAWWHRTPEHSELEGTLRATPATLCSYLSDCFHLLLLPGASLISRQRQSLSLYSLQLWQLSQQGLRSPCPRCLNPTKLIHCSFYCFQICFLQMFPPISPGTIILQFQLQKILTHYERAILTYFEKLVLVPLPQ